MSMAIAYRTAHHFAADLRNGYVIENAEYAFVAGIS
jgi:hypothetical protein